MNKITSDLLFIILFCVLTIANYAVLTFIDFSFGFFVLVLARTLIGGLCYFYFFQLAEHIYTKFKFNKMRGYPAVFKKTGWTFIPVIIFFIHLISIASATDLINDLLISSNNSLAIATIKDCHKSSRGTEYCVYSYSIGKNYYEIKYKNEPTNLKLMEGDTASILYYANFPQISRLKKDWH